MGVDSLKKKNKSWVSTVVSADRPGPIHCAPDAPELFENEYIPPVHPPLLIAVTDVMDNRPRDVAFTGDERFHDADIEVCNTYSQSTDTKSYNSGDSIGSFSLYALQCEAQRVEPSSDLPLVSKYNLLLNTQQPSFDSLAAVNPQHARVTPLPQPQLVRRLNAETVVDQDSQLVSDVVADVLDEFLRSRTLDIALSIHLRPLQPSVPRLQVHFRPITSKTNVDQPVKYMSVDEQTKQSPAVDGQRKRLVKADRSRKLYVGGVHTHTHYHACFHDKSAEIVSNFDNSVNEHLLVHVPHEHIPLYDEMSSQSVSDQEIDSDDDDLSELRTDCDRPWDYGNPWIHGHSDDCQQSCEPLSLRDSDVRAGLRQHPSAAGGAESQLRGALSLLG